MTTSARSAQIAAAAGLVLLATTVTGCSSEADCAGVSAAATDAVTQLLDRAPDADSIDELCGYVENPGAADDADLEVLRGIAAESGDATVLEGEAMGTTVQVEVSSADGASIHVFTVFSTRENHWAVQIDTLAD